MARVVLTKRLSTYHLIINDSNILIISDKIIITLIQNVCMVIALLYSL